MINRVRADERPAAARTSSNEWSLSEHKAGPVRLVAVGPRSSVFAQVAAALEPKAFGSVELYSRLPSLKQAIEQNVTAEQMPEVFCFGLLEQFDLEQIAALGASGLR